MFDRYITASYKNVSTPANPNSLADLAYSAGDRELVVNEDVSKHIGLNGWNELDTMERRSLLNELVREDNATNSKRRRELVAKLRTHDSLFHQGIMPNDVDTVTLDELTNVFGGLRTGKLILFVLILLKTSGIVLLNHLLPLKRIR